MKVDLVLPTGAAPSNLVLPNDTRTRMIDSDMYGICKRVAEVSRKLYIVVHEKPDGTLLHYSIMENCDDGVQRLALNVGPGRPIDALDARVIERLEWMIHVPLDKRVDEMEKMEAADKEAEKERSLEELYEKMGRQMHFQLERDGFISGRGISTPKRGVKPARTA